MSDDPWNINPSKKKEIRERIEKKAKERSEKTFFQKYGNFLGILLFAFVELFPTIVLIILLNFGFSALPF